MKKILSVFLCIAMVLSLAPALSFAEERAIFTTETLEEYCVYSGEIATDGYIGIPVGVKTYTKGGTTEDTPLIIYVVNTNTKRVGMKSDEELIKSFLDRDYIVTVLDYYNNEKATSPAIDWSVQGIKTAIRTTDAGKTYLAGNSFSGIYDYILPAGYDIERQMVYWSYDLHGADGLFDFVISSWNNDFKGVRGYDTITFPDGTTTTVKEYTESLPGGKVTSIEQCINKDGSFIDLDLYMDIIYPAEPEEEVPVLMYAQSSQNTVGTWNTEHRPHMSGFLFRGYAGALFDYPYMPMARTDHYGYYDGNGAGGQYGWVTGDNNTFSLGAGSQQRSCTAAVRLMRYLADNQPDKYKFDADDYGLVCISKTSNVNRLANPNVEELPERRFYEGHHGETRYDNGLTEDICDEDGNVIVRGAEPQPWLAYKDGSKIPSNVQCVYSTSGGATDSVCQGSAPMYLSGTQASGGCYFNSYPAMMSACYRNDIPTLGYTCPNVGHDFCIDPDGIYGNDTYLALFEFFDYYLQDVNARCEYIDPVNGTKDIEATDIITVKFNAPVSESEIEKVTITNSSTGELAVGSWSACYGNTEWEFTPHNLKGGYVYTVNVPKSIKAENGKEIQKGKISSFTVKPEKMIEAQSVKISGDTVNNENGAYIEFEDIDFSNSTSTAIRFAVTNDAANNALIYSAIPDGEGSYAEGELLGKVNLCGAGDYDFDVTEYVNSLEEGEKAAFVIKAEKASGETVMFNANYNSLANDNRSMLKGGAYGGVTDEISYTEGGKSVKITGNPINDEFAPYHYYYDNSIMAIQHRVPSAITEADYGRRFKASFYVYDTTSRRISASTGADVSGEEIDTRGNGASFTSKENEWICCEFDYRFDKLKPFDKNKLMITFRMFGNVSENYPVYFDDLTITEYVTDIELAKESGENSCAPSMVVHPADTVSAQMINGSYVENSFADKSFEDEDILKVSGRSGGAYADRNVYALIDLDEVTTGASIKLKVLSTNTGTIGVYGVSDKNITDSFDVNSVSYINSPVSDRFSHGPLADKVYGGGKLASVEVTAPGYYTVDVSEYALAMKESGAAKGLLVFKAETVDSNMNFEFADGSENEDAYLKVMDFDNKASFVHSRSKPEVNTVADIRIGSQGSCNYELSSLVDRTSNTGKSLKLYLGESYTFFKLYNTFDHVLTSEDVGRKIKVSFWAKSDISGAVNIGYTSCMQPTAESGFTNYYSSFYVGEQINLTAGKWQKFDFEVTVTEEMTSEYYEGYESSYYNPAMFTIGCTKSIKGATVYFDDFVIEEVIEEEQEEEEAVPAEPYTYSYDFEKADSTAYYWNGFESRKDKAYWTNSEGENHTENGSGCMRILTDKTYNRFWLSNIIDGINSSTESRSLDEGDIGRSFTVSYWVKSMGAGSYVMRMGSKRNGYYDYEGVITKDVVFTEADVGVWKKVTYSFTVDEAMVTNGVDTLVMVFNGFNQTASSKEAVTNTCMLYFDDVSSTEIIEGEGGSLIESAVTLSSYSDGLGDIGVNTSSSAAVRGIKKAYVHFEPQELENVQKAMLNIDVTEASVQKLKVYGLVDCTYPADALTYSNAPATNSDESMDASLVYSGAALDEITVSDSGIYGFDVTEYVKAQGTNECIFVITSEDNGDLEYVSFDFSTYPMSAGKDYISDGSVDFTGGMATVNGTKLVLLNALSNENAPVKAGTTYKISAVVTSNEAGDVIIGLADSEGNMGECSTYTLEADSAETLTFTHTATAEDEQNGMCAIVITAPAGFVADDVTMLSNNTVSMSKSVELSSYTAILPDTDTTDVVELNVSTIGGNSVSVNGENKGANATQEVYRGGAIELSSSGDGKFLYWIDTNSNTILSYDASYSYIAGTKRSIAAVYADETEVFVTFTSMANKLVGAGIAASITVPEDPYVYGYKFSGWYNGSEKTSLVAGGVIDADKNTEYAAGFYKDTTAYEVNINGTSESYTYNEKVSVLADAEKDGEAFSYWMRDGVIVSYSADYSFYVNGATTVTAIYGKSAQSGIVLAMAAPVLVDGTKIAFFAERNIPESYTVIETGIIMGTSSGLTIDNSSIRAVAKNLTNKGQFTVRKAGVKPGDVYYGAAYAICRSESGEVLTVYSNEVSYTVE